MSMRVQSVVLGIVLVLSIASFAIARLYSPSLAFKVGIAPVIFTGLALLVTSSHSMTMREVAFPILNLRLASGAVRCWGFR